MSNTNVFEGAKVTRDKFSSDWRKVTDDYQKEVAAIKRDYKATRLRDELIRAKKQYEERLERKKQEAISFVTQMIEGERETQSVKIRVIPEAKLAKLKSLEDIPLSAAELHELVEQFSGDYWAERFLGNLMERNGVTLPMSPDYGTRMSILQDLEDGIVNYINQYSGSDTHYTVIADVADLKIYDFERKYTDNYATLNLDRGQIAERALSAIRTKGDVFSRALMLRNVLGNSDKKLKQEIMYQLSQNDDLISSDLLILSGLRNRYREFMENEAQSIQSARSLYEELQQLEDEMSVSERLIAAKNQGEITPQFVEIMEEVVEKNEILAKGCGLCESPELIRLVSPQNEGKGE